MTEEPTNTADQSEEPSEELGWDFNNEVNFTLLELNALKKARDKIQRDSTAFEQRIGSLNAIQEFLNRKK